MEAGIPALDSQRVEGGEPGFSLRGRTFRFRPAGNPDRYAAIWSADTDSETLRAVDVFVVDVLIDDETREDWRFLREEGDPPLWFDELFAVARHIASVTAARPTMPSSGSSVTAPQSGTASTAGSPSPAAVPSAA